MPAGDSEIYQQAVAGGLAKLDGMFNLERPLSLEKASFGPANQPVVIFRINQPGRLNDADYQFLADTVQLINGHARVLVVVTPRNA